MKFPAPLKRGRLVRRYKRFLADVILDDGDEVTAHCANPGSMLGLKEPGSVVWVSRAENPKRKLKYDFQLIEADGTLVAINANNPNALVEEAIRDGKIAELSGYTRLAREVRYGRNSRIDILLGGDGKPDCYIEIKNVHLLRKPGLVEFPDSVTARGAKHLFELGDMAAAGHRAAMVYLVQRADGEAFSLAADIDPAYARAFETAKARGVEAFAYRCNIALEGIAVKDRIPIVGQAQ